jgi:hypothetical protein
LGDWLVLGDTPRAPARKNSGFLFRETELIWTDVEKNIKLISDQYYVTSSFCQLTNLQVFRYIKSMNKKILITLAMVTLLASILTGCGKTQGNPAPSLTGLASPTATPGDNADTSSSNVQSGVPLTISEPIDAATLTTGTITVKGQTLPGATISVNDQAGTADGQGNFSIPVSLDDGPNAIDVIAIDSNGNQGEALLMVNVEMDSSAVPGNSSAVPTDTTILLKIISPVDGADINGDKVTVSGQTAPGATININDQAATADGKGNFSIPITLNAGPNSIDVVAVDDNGNQNEVILMVNDTSGS